MSIDDVARQLNRVLDVLPDDVLIEAAAALDFAIEDLYPLALESDCLVESVQGWQQAAVAIAQVREACHRAGELVEQYLGAIGASRVFASGSAPAAAGSTPVGRAQLSSKPPNAIGIDGSEYPPEAGWGVDELPSRVRRQGDRTVGKLKIGDRPIHGEFRSGEWDVWAFEAKDRIKELGIRAAPFVPFHVEMRAAAMMIRSGVTSAEVTINNVPCGYQSFPRGCHQVLEPFLPEGTQLTVSGTNRQGQPYRHTYHGKATR